MKKNIMTVIIMAATVINLILMVVVVFSVVPSMNKSNALVEKIASIIDLEIEAQNPEGSTYTVKDLDLVELAYTDKQTVNLKASADGKAHYAMLDSVKLSLNKTADDYSDIKSSIEATPGYIQDMVINEIGKYSYDDLNKAGADSQLRKDILKKIQDFYTSQAMVDVTLGNFLYS